MKSKNIILIVAAHPDDEILGCGGIIARLAKEGSLVYTLILGEGITSRDDVRSQQSNLRGIENLKQQAYAANKVLGVKDIFFHDFADNRFDTVALLDVVKVIEKVIDRVGPAEIFTHYKNDLNIDHKITYNATIVATRPVVGQKVKAIYSYEVSSSTEWNFPLSFSPDMFFDISKTIDLKLKAMSRYETELRHLPHPRSLESIKLNSRLWGIKVGLKYAEAFQLVRGIK